VVGEVHADDDARRAMAPGRGHRLGRSLDRDHLEAAAAPELDGRPT
jgi:hypothetical protein